MGKCARRQPRTAEIGEAAFLYSPCAARAVFYEKKPSQPAPLDWPLAMLFGVSLLGGGGGGRPGKLVTEAVFGGPRRAKEAPRFSAS